MPQEERDAAAGIRSMQEYQQRVGADAKAIEDIVKQWPPEFLMGWAYTSAALDRAIEGAIKAAEKRVEAKWLKAVHSDVVFGFINLKDFPESEVRKLAYTSGEKL